MKAVANYSFNIPMLNGSESSFTKDKEYEYKKISSSYVIMDDNKYGLILEGDRNFLDCFRFA